MIRWTSRLLPAVALAAAATLPLQAEEMEAPAIGEAAPAFTLTNAEGEDVSLSDFAGQTLVIQFQSCQCPWDVAYQPYLNALAEEFSDDDVVFLGINSNKAETYDTIAAYNAGENQGVAYEVLKDPGNAVADAFGAKTTPHMYVIDGDGVLRYRGGIEAVPGGMQQVGQMEEQFLGPVLAALVDGSEPPYTETTSKGCSIKRE